MKEVSVLLVVERLLRDPEELLSGLLVHVGVAISTIDPQEAEETYRYLKAMGEMDGLDAVPAGAPPP